MTPESFIKYWKETYSECPPVGYLLRENYVDIWLRIHTLPLSKRYAETEEEKKEILKRHNLILSDLLSEGGNYILVTTEYSSNPSPTQIQGHLDILDEDKCYLFSLAKHELEMDDEPYYWHFFMMKRKWKEKSVDNLLKLVANEEVNDVLFIGVEQNCVYYPYDGGADIFIKSNSKRKSIKNKYSAWLSEHPLGL
jgi:hypothetical protein